jgi:hypothetical protein
LPEVTPDDASNLEWNALEDWLLFDCPQGCCGTVV